MGIAVPETISGEMSSAEFRSFQERRPDHERWELLAGVPMMMTPPTLVHNRIASNLERLLNSALEQMSKPWVAVQRPGLEFDSGNYRPEPDVAVIDADFDEDQRFVHRAYLLAEIVSISDEIGVPKLREPWIDVKRRIYRAHALCKAVLIVQQDRIEAEVDLRIGEAWQSSTLSGGEAELHLPAFGVRCLLGDLYDGTPLRPRKQRP
ncbi:Uma2 family endonuclease [Rhodopseudomonas palustris]|uniref:Uma2 family endonuclease n=1 Tax=Rhodopseudomonas palustris TaxID=1076 RepID=UPI0020CDF31E|nr:Uma2 family endonuclease [Rhodopseudomonas palustris]MCP9628673.1 Uma2 family endonuclease [Rhodopseudomonas palustris]